MAAPNAETKPYPTAPAPSAHAPTYAVRGLDAATAAALRAGAPDALGRSAERLVATGVGEPCRVCLGQIPAGAPYLLASHAPFAGANAYAERGPIFLCADACAPYADEGVPATFRAWPRILLRGYDAEARIIGATAQIVPGSGIDETLARLFERPDVQFVDVRSATHGCWQARARRAR